MNHIYYSCCLFNPPLGAFPEFPYPCLHLQQNTYCPELTLINALSWFNVDFFPFLSCFLSSPNMSASCLYTIEYCILPFGDRNGNPLQYPCLENLMDRGAWQAIVHGVAKSRIRLKQLSTHTRMHIPLILANH